MRSAALVYEPEHLTRSGLDLVWNETKHPGERVPLETDFVDSLGGQWRRGHPGPGRKGQQEGHPDFAPAAIGR